MKVNVAKPSRHLPGKAQGLASFVLLLSATPGRAAVDTCSDVTDRSFFCRLHGILNLLSVTAVILGVFLVIAITVAVWFYRRNRNIDLTPP